MIINWPFIWDLLRRKKKQKKTSTADVSPTTEFSPAQIEVDDVAGIPDWVRTREQNIKLSVKKNKKHEQ